LKKIEHRGFAALGLFNPKSADNFGGVLRASLCYNVAMVAAQGIRFTYKLGKLRTDTTDAWKQLPLIETTDLMSIIPHGTVPVAVEFIESATSLVDYVHPERAFYIFGPEDGSISKEILEKCRDVVYVPTSHCMNLASTVNVVLYDRLAKQSKKTSSRAS
jgi:tRNA(Leu) C34 or U34 (ribose-2'-O)-methylase TrmL